MVVLYVVIMSIIFERCGGLLCLCVLHVVCFVLVCVWVLFYFGMRCDLNSCCFDVLLDACVV